MRSKLFVPGNRPELFAKALQYGADAVCFDLEDAVLPEQKAAARDHVATFLKHSPETRTKLLVRVNAIGTPWFKDDLAAVLKGSLTTIALPKVNTADEVLHAERLLLDVEAQNQARHPVNLLPVIETATGLRHIFAIAGSSKRIKGMQLGLLDLLLDLGVSQSSESGRLLARWELRKETAAVGVPCYDSAFPDFRDEASFERELQIARELGFAGASCIHPLQIPIANRVFSPTDQEVQQAQCIHEAALAAASQGIGVFALDGEMIDQPLVLRARQLLDSLVAEVS